MHSIPLSVKVTQAFLFLAALIWLIFGFIVVAGLHPALPEEPLLRWGMGTTAFVGGMVLAGLGIFLMKRNRFLYWISLIGLGLVTLVNFFDDLGWVDVGVALISLLPFILLLKDRHWYLQSK